MSDGQNTGGTAKHQQGDRNDCQAECLDVGPHITKQYFVAPPGSINITSVTHDAVSLSWDPPQGLTESMRFRVTWKCESTRDLLCSEVPVPNLCIQGLTPGMKYEFTVVTINDTGEQSLSVSTTKTTDVLEPKELKTEVTTTSARLSWTLPYEMDLTSHSFRISYSSTEKDEEFISTSSYRTVITGLKPDTEYTVRVSVVCHSGICQPATTTFHTNGDERPLKDKQDSITSASKDLPPPGPIKITTVAHGAVSLSWEPPKGLTKSMKFRVTWKSEREGDLYRSEVPVANHRIQGLTPGVKYEFTVVTISDSGGQSTSVSTTHTTDCDERSSKHKQHSTASASEGLVNGKQSGSDRAINNSSQSALLSRNTKGDGDNRPPEHKQYSTSSTSEGLVHGKQSGSDNSSQSTRWPWSTKGVPSRKTYYTLATGMSAKYSLGIKKYLTHLSEVKSEQTCDMILAACIVVSNAGRDVEAALKDIPEAKPTILVVLHHTIDPDHVVRDSSKFTKRDDMLIVDCLFNEDDGLLRCERNDIAQSTMLKWIDTKVQNGAQIHQPQVSTKETSWSLSSIKWS